MDGFLDFEIEIGEHDGAGYPLAVVQSPAGNARSRLRLTLGELELENRLLALQNALLRSGGQRRKVLSEEERTVQTFGRELFAALLHDDLRALFFQSRQIAESQGCGLRLKLRINAAELAMLPWEFLFDDRPGEYVCLSQSTPLVRYLETASPPRPLKVTPPLRILGLIASPPGLPPLDIAVEKERLERAVAGLKRRGLVELVWLDGQSWRDLFRAVRPGQGPWHVFHFVGHGSFDSLREEGVLAVTGDEGQPYLLTATDLGRVLGDHPTLRLALLNACEGGLASRRDIFSSTAATLVRRGVPAVIAMQVEITDRAAIEFSTQFYEALADGLPVDAAVTEARKAVSLALANTLEWGIPMLLMRAPDGVLFDVQSVSPPPEPVSPPEERPAPAVPLRPVEDVRQTQLQRRLGVLTEQYEAAFDQLNRTLSEADAVKLREQIAAIEREMREIEAQLGTAPRPQPAGEEKVTPPAEVKRPPAPRAPIEFDWVEIPAGEFVMGSDKAKDKDAWDDETPQHRVSLPAYRMARVPVTVAQFAAFVKGTGYKTTAEEQGSAYVYTGQCLTWGCRPTAGARRVNNYLPTN